MTGEAGYVKSRLYELLGLATRLASNSVVLHSEKTIPRRSVHNYLIIFTRSNSFVSRLGRLAENICISLRSESLPACLRNTFQCAFWSVLGPELVPAIIGRFQRQAERTNGIEDSVNLAYSFAELGISIKPLQIRNEIEGLLRHLERLNPKTVLEIGTARGGTLFMFTRVAAPNACIVSIDLPRGVGSGGYPDWVSPLYYSFRRGTQTLHILRCDSHDMKTLQMTQKLLGDGNIDFLFIDGDHTYEGVKRDFEMYSPLVRDGGIIAFHDVCHGPEEAVGGVPRFWGELTEHRKTHTIISNDNQRGYGIGMILVGEDGGKSSVNERTAFRTGNECQKFVT